MSDADRATPLISLCVPTHDGRRALLAQLLEDVVEQACELPDDVEICISDNASRDGTEELVAALAARARCRIVYRRQPRDIGMAPNLLSVVELASGDYCWLMGSDDLLAPHALRRVCELLRALPGASGYIVGSVYVDAEDPELRSRQLPRAFLPAGDASRLIEGVDAIYEVCGNAWIGLSWNIVERERWLRAVRLRADLVRAHPVWPQVVAFATIAGELPRWGWLAEPLLRMRNADPFLFESGSAPLADRWSELVGGLAAAWGGVVGRRTRRWRRSMRRLNAVWGGGHDARATKLYGDPSLRSQTRLAVTWLRAFWPAPGYWRDGLPATLAPVWLTRARHAPEGGALRRQRQLVPRRDNVDVDGQLPPTLPAGGVAMIGVTVSNRTRAVVNATGPDAITLGQRWRTSDGDWVSWEALRANDLARMPQSLPRALRRGRDLTTEVALYAPFEAGTYRLEVVAHRVGSGWLDDAGLGTALAGDVSVVA